MRGVLSSIVTSLFSTKSSIDSSSNSISQFIQETFSQLKDDEEGFSVFQRVLEHMQQASPSLYLWLLLLLVIGSITTSSSSNKKNNGTTEAFREWIVQNMKNIPKHTAAIVARRSISMDSNSNSPNDDNSDNNSKRNRGIVSPANLESLKESFQWWEDLAPPFAFRDTEHDDEEEHDDHEDDETDDEINDHQHRGRSRKQQLDLGQFFSSSTSLREQQQAKRPLSPSSTASASSFSSSASNTPAASTATAPDLDVLHFCFLVHGHRGFSQDLSYMQTVMQRTANSRKRKEKRKRRRRQPRGRSSSPEHDEAPAIEKDGSDEVASSITATQSTDSTATATTTATTSTSTTTTTASNSSPKDDGTRNNNSFAQDMVVHAVVCNERKTDDGVAAGGERLVKEIKSVIAKQMENRHPSRRAAAAAGNNEQLQDITISFVGNSLGGLYSRYAVAKLVEQCQAEHDSTDHDCLILEGRYRLHFNVFCTTATPHLGVASHTFLPIPRTAEIGVAHAMGSTGKDLFRLNDLIHDMATSSHFLQPLSAFRKRIAYANAYGTDFPVPAQTAAFLNEDSSYPHYFAEQQEGGTSNGEVGESSSSLLSESGESLVIATLHTPKRWSHRGTHKSSSDGDHTSLDWTAAVPPASSFINPEDEDARELARMSASLDSLGWKKVFIDARKLMPKIPIPKAATSALSRFTFSSSSSSLDAGVPADQSSSETTDDGENTNSGRVSALMSTSPAESTSSNNLSKTDSTSPATAASDTSNALTGDDEPRRVEAIARLKEKGGVVGSKDVAEAVLGPALFDEQFFHWPLGHNMMVAFSRNRLSTYMNKAGRPVVDSLARELVKDIFEWKPPASLLETSTKSTPRTNNNNTNAVSSEDMAATTTM